MTPRSPARRASRFPPDLARTRRRSGADGPEPRGAALRAQRPARARRQSASHRRRPARCGSSRAAEAAAGAASSPGSTRASLLGSRSSVDFAYDFRGNASLSLAPQAGDTRWTVQLVLAEPELRRRFPAGARTVDDKGFEATYRVGNLALGRSLVSTGDAGASAAPRRRLRATADPDTPARSRTACRPPQISLIQPVDLYSQVNRATKYGFLFIGFTFLALLMFDVIGGVRVSAVEYLLMGAALVLFFVLLLAFAEVIGFTAGLSRRLGGDCRAQHGLFGGGARQLAASGVHRRPARRLYAVLYVLLSLEAFSLLIGSLLLFAALAGVMYATRRIDWGAARRAAEVRDPRRTCG